MTATPSYTLIENLVEAVQEIPVDSIVSRTVYRDDTFKGIDRKSTRLNSSHRT